MHIDPSAHAKGDAYKLFTNLVVPRPIAWISSMNRMGLINLAPFSFFNAIAGDPLYVVIGIGRRDDGTPKDTARNIIDLREFVINMVTEDLLGEMNITAAEFPADESEVTASHLQVAPSMHVAVPRLARCQASLECRLFQSQSLGTSTLIIGEVVMFHIADHCLGPNLHVSHFAPIGRLGSPSVYCRTIDRFELPRITYAQWKKTSQAATCATASLPE
jgi:flavin reductase (DIM6/NTAB) family NADH-FMN oxidoreductase RutF